MQVLDASADCEFKAGQADAQILVLQVAMLVTLLWIP
jgi:hypothetical protein